MKLNLTVAEGANKGKVISVSKTQFLVGRDATCHLRPASQAVSKRHCALLIRDGKVFIRDLKSTNGTFVNDQQITGEVELQNGDRVTIGPLAFVVAHDGSTAGGVPVNTPTPTPDSLKAKPRAKPKAAVDEESVAEMLLKLDEEEEAATEGVIDDNIPGGSTMFEMPVIQTKEDESKKEEEEKAEPSKYDQAKAAQVTTSSAAKDILDKYTRRSR